MKLLQKAIKNKLKKKKKAEIRKQKKLERNMKSVTKPEEPQKQSTKPALAIDDKIIYSKFDFAFSDSKSKNNNSQKDPKRALEKIEKTRAKLKELENSGRNAKASALKMKQSWISALQKAEGVKVKDDVDLIKKSIKKKEHKKNKSKKMWEERNKQVELRKEEQQKKRRDNIADRNKKKKQKKIKRAIKKGRIIQ
ncbi:hypothetical protein AAG570_008865 [Ranatra chinensis]|uniref:Ribosomal RNA-processing protein 14/surfeit locus protein 6 C-terminal domain-containing protein n=1 Tax=Ranatra chinensis TaxID=642074 RepID=A0ABD0ZDA8_9HEMI